MDTKRLILFVIFSFSLMLLWDSFQKQNIKVEQALEQTASADGGLPRPSANFIAQNDLPKTTSKFSLSSGGLINVDTDLLTLTINTVGGDIRELKFNEHQAEDSKGKYLFMTDVGNPLFYVAQSGLLAEGLPTHKSNFISDKKSYQMDSDKLIVPLMFETPAVSVKNI